MSATSMIQVATELRRWLIVRLAGPEPKCAQCGAEYTLQIDHVDGRDWTVRLEDSYVRIRRYWREFLRGVELRVLCKSCNGGRRNNSWRGEGEGA